MTATTDSPRVPTDSLGNPITVPDSDDILVVEASDGSRWELVCGLEVHAELATATKMFSAAPNNFGDDPNTNVDPVTLGDAKVHPVARDRDIILQLQTGQGGMGEIYPRVDDRHLDPLAGSPPQ